MKLIKVIDNRDKTSFTTLTKDDDVSRIFIDRGMASWYIEITVRLDNGEHHTTTTSEARFIANMDNEIFEAINTAVRLRG